MRQEFRGGKMLGSDALREVLNLGGNMEGSLTSDSNFCLNTDYADILV